MTQLSAERRQERRSRNQFTSRVEDFGWLVDSIETDIGEDLMVRVLDRKQFSGITFFVQMKSRASISARERARREYSQKIDVDHLVHWEASAVPVVLVIWDVERHDGYWEIVDDALRALDKAKPGYRKQTTVQVGIPFANATDDTGLNALRKELAHRCLPSVQRGRKIPLEIRFQFGKTAKGKRQQQALDAALAHGTRAEIDGRYIKQFQPTGWAGRLFGEADQPTAVIITPWISKESPKVPIRIESIAGDGCVLASIPYVELQLKRQGHTTVTLANDDQPGSFGFEMTLPRKGPGEAKVNYRIRPIRASINDVRTAVRFGDSMMIARALRVVQLRGGKAQEYPVVKGKGIAPSVVQAVEKLGVIQDRVQDHGTIQLEKGVSFSLAQQQQIDRLHSILTTGRHRFSGSFSIVAKRAAIPALADQLQATLKSGKPPDLSVVSTSKDRFLDVFGVTVPITRLELSSTARITARDISGIRRIGRGSKAATVPLEFKRAMLQEECVDFVPKNPRE